MRNIRTLGLCLVAAFMMSALAAVPAMAEGKPSEWKPFAHCPLKYPEEPPFTGTKACVWAKSSYDEVCRPNRHKFPSEAECEEYLATHPAQHSEFKAGNVTVQLTKPLTLLGGYRRNTITHEDGFIGPEGGALTLKPVAEPGPNLTEGVDPALLSEAELKRYEADVAAGKTKTTVKIELAGPPTSVILNEERLLEGQGTALGLPVKVKLGNPFLGKSCYVGSDENPIEIDLTTGKSGALQGKVGYLASNEAGSILTISTDTLVNETYTSPGVEGCGVNGGADAALDAQLGLPSASGNRAIIVGSLKQAGAEEAEEEGGL